MGLYFIIVGGERQNGDIVGGREIQLNVVENQTWGGGQTVLRYESPGTNGGVVIITGRTTNSITLTGRILTSSVVKSIRRSASGRLLYGQAPGALPLINLNSLKNEFLRLKDQGKPITLLAPIDNNDTGRYIIEEFRGNLEQGQSSSLSFTMTLVEHRQSNLKRTIVNLISFEPGEQFKQILEAQTTG